MEVILLEHRGETSGRGSVKVGLGPGRVVPPDVVIGPFRRVP